MTDLQYKCDKCGPLDEVIVDGYLFAETILEGVHFRIILEDGKAKCLGVIAEHQEYFNDFNMRKWIKKAATFAQETDILSCPKCGQDVDNPLPTKRVR